MGGGVGYSWNILVSDHIDMQTKSASTVEGIQGLNDEIDDLQKNPATPEELKRARRHPTTRSSSSSTRQKSLAGEDGL